MSDETPLPEETAPVPATGPPRSDAGFSWGVALFLLIGLGFVVFAVQNMTDVPVQFLGWDFTVSLPLLLVVIALIAVIADEVVGMVWRRRRRKRLVEREELERYRRQ
ncbi:MAG TPA: hypothetical protein VLA54_10635 [Acidimicrobiia bacterium]|nr:hypothetical protein [Acidimicrobiia bacterium]